MRTECIEAFLYTLTVARDFHMVYLNKCWSRFTAEAGLPLSGKAYVPPYGHRSIRLIMIMCTDMDRPGTLEF